MQRFKSAITLALATFLLTAGTTGAQEPSVVPPDPRATGCLAPNYAVPGTLRWFLGIHPADDLLTVWCRIQDLPGSLRFNVMFPTTNAHRSWDTSFDGPTLPAARIAEIVQSLLPVRDGPARDENGMEFPRVLKNVVQLSAASAPDGMRLGFASTHPAARRLVLWEPIILRVRPVAMADREFTLSILLRPDLGMLALGLQGRGTDVRLQGWKGRLDAGSWWGNKCSSAIPFCNDLPEVVEFHAPWVVSEVRLDAEGENMTSTAASIMNHLMSANRLEKNPTMYFDRHSGRGSFVHSDGYSTVRMEAEGSSGGTKRIVIKWTENSAEGSYRRALQREGATYRSGSQGSAPPSVPDSLGRL